MIPHTILDIETISIPEDEIRASLPDFNPDRVKLGVAKKPETIEKIIEEARASYGNDIIEKAALDPRFGQVAIVGLIDHKGNIIQECNYDGESEICCLNNAWGALDQAQVDWNHKGKNWTPEPKPIYIETLAEIREFHTPSTIPILGFNIKGFDLPFLVARSLILGVQVPASIWNPRHRYPFSDRICDMMEVMSFGNKSKQYSSLDDALRMFGIPVNPHGDGSKFGEIWATDKAKALKYNAHDLTSEQALAGKLGLV